MEVSTLDYIKGIMNIYNYKDTQGIIILKSGIVIRVKSFFEYIREMWNDYKEATRTDNKELLDSLLHQTNGYIVSTNEVDVYLPEISAMLRGDPGVNFGDKKKPTLE